MEYFNHKLAPAIDRVLGMEFYNQGGAKERIFDDLDKGFGLKNLPRSFMAENAVFLILTALIRNFHQLIRKRQAARRYRGDIAEISKPGRRAYALINRKLRLRGDCGDRKCSCFRGKGG